MARYFRYTAPAYGLTGIGPLFCRWAMDNDQEALILAEPGASAVVGRLVPADYFTPQDGVDFVRVYQSDKCFAFIDQDSLFISLATRPADPEAALGRLVAWIRNALTALSIPVTIEDLTVSAGGKIIGLISPPYEEGGFYLFGAVIFFSYDQPLAGKVLRDQTVPLDKISGISSLGYRVTRGQLVDQLEKSFTKDMHGVLTPEPLDNIRAELEALDLLHKTGDWIDEGII